MLFLVVGLFVCLFVCFILYCCFCCCCFFVFVSSIKFVFDGVRVSNNSLVQQQTLAHHAWYVGVVSIQTILHEVFSCFRHADNDPNYFGMLPRPQDQDPSHTYMHVFYRKSRFLSRKKCYCSRHSYCYSYWNKPPCSFLFQQISLPYET